MAAWYKRKRSNIDERYFLTVVVGYGLRYGASVDVWQDILLARHLRQYRTFQGVL